MFRFGKKNAADKNVPYGNDNATDFTLVWIIDDNVSGYFKFPKETLLEKKILRSDHQTGKMGIRVYPLLTSHMNQTAQQTHHWQSEYYHAIK